MEISVKLDPESSLPMFTQLSKIIREKIVAGLLSSGTKLPSARELAEELDIARTTVVKAYDDLINQGYLTAIIGSGTFVSDRVMEKGEFFSGIEKNFRQDDHHLSSYAKSIKALPAVKALSVENEFQNYGAPAQDILPVKDWKKILFNEISDYSLQSVHWTPEAFGLYRLRLAVAKFLSRTRGAHCSPEQVMIFAGSKESFSFMTRLILNEGDLFAVENPSYVDPRNQLSLSGAEIFPVESDNEGLIVSKILEAPRQIKLLYTTPIQDPTGIIMSEERRRTLIDLAKKNDFLIWEEAWDSDYIYTMTAPTPLLSLDKSSKVFYSYSFWKLLYPLTTIGILIVPPHLVTTFKQAKKNNEIQFSILEQKVLAAFLEAGYLDKQIKLTKKLYESRRKAAFEAIHQEFFGEVEAPKQTAGLHICLRFPEDYDSEVLLKASIEAKLPLVSTIGYYMKDLKKNEFLLPFALLSEDTLQNRVKAFGALL